MDRLAERVILPMACVKESEHLTQYNAEESDGNHLTKKRETQAMSCTLRLMRRVNLCFETFLSCRWKPSPIQGLPKLMQEKSSGEINVADMTGVITVAGNVDLENMKDFGSKSFAENLNNYRKMVTVVITIDGNIIDHSIEKDFGFESFVEYLNNYMKMVTGVIIVAKIIDHETVKDFGFVSFIADLNNLHGDSYRRDHRC